jgi:uncharacterized protein YjcR
MSTTSFIDLSSLVGENSGQIIALSQFSLGLKEQQDQHHTSLVDILTKLNTQQNQINELAISIRQLTDQISTCLQHSSGKK